jgi:hypothetical protein
MKKHLVLCAAILLSTVGAFCQAPEEKFEQIRSRADSEKNRDLELLKAFKSGEISNRELGSLKSFTLNFNKGLSVFCSDFNYSQYWDYANKLYLHSLDFDDLSNNSGLHTLVRFMRECNNLETLCFDLTYGVSSYFFSNTLLVLGTHTPTIRNLTNLRSVRIRAFNHMFCLYILVGLPNCVEKLSFYPDSDSGVICNEFCEVATFFAVHKGSLLSQISDIEPENLAENSKTKAFSGENLVHIDFGNIINSLFEDLLHCTEKQARDSEYRTPQNTVMGKLINELNNLPRPETASFDSKVLKTSLGENLMKKCQYKIDEETRKVSFFFKTQSLKKQLIHFCKLNNINI